MAVDAHGLAAQQTVTDDGIIRLLLVDDDPDNLVSLEATLQGLADELVCAQSGPQALRHLLEHDFAAILLDVKMPEMDGFETAELIRKRKRSRHTPILFLTGYRNDEHLFRGYDLGAVDFLFKPIVPEVLRSKVLVFVELARNARLLQQQANTLAKAEQRFRSLLEAAPDAMLISREDGSIVLINSRTEELFGWPRDLMLGRNLRMIVPDWCHVGQMNNVELRAIRRDGSGFPAEMTFSPLQTDEGLLITTVVRDISDRKRAEEDIRRLNATLERRVAARTAELMSSNEALRQFGWAASHDLQEPLRMVVSYSQMLERRLKTSQLDPDTKMCLDYVVTGASRLENLLAALREFMHASDTGRHHLQLVDCAIPLRTAIENLQSVITGANAQVTNDPLPAVMASPVLMVQIFQNLIGNSIKYCETQPRVHVHADRHGAEWCFAIRDNGIGIDPRHSQFVFGVFRRLFRDEYPGTGIGLAICRAAVERLGGRIWVESEGVGQGSTFKFTIPVPERA
jgi:PAS domain S-box-containing protein